MNEQRRQRRFWRTAYFTPLLAQVGRWREREREAERGQTMFRRGISANFRRRHRTAVSSQFTRFNCYRARRVAKECSTGGCKRRLASKIFCFLIKFPQFDRNTAHQSLSDCKHHPSMVSSELLCCLRLGNFP